jgi:hypothetical protein
MIKIIQALVLLVFCCVQNGFGQILEFYSNPNFHALTLTQHIYGHRKGEIKPLQSCFFEIKIYKKDSSISGRYFYDTDNNRKLLYLPVRGVLLPNDSMLLSVYDNKGNLNATTELKRNSNDSYEEWWKGKFKSQQSESVFSVDLEGKRQLKNKIVFYKGKDTLVYKLSPGLNQVSYNVYLNKFANNTHYLMFEYRYLEYGRCQSRGSCGCGEAAKLIYLEVSNSLKAIRKKEFQSESCGKNISISKKQKGNALELGIVQLISSQRLESDYEWKTTELVFNLNDYGKGLTVTESFSKNK